MHEKANNLFTFYRGPSATNDKSPVGRQIEDNATASVLKLIYVSHGAEPWVARELIEEPSTKQVLDKIHRK